jgi:FkbH-like protein
MVIWDLDETFWSGTLSEGGIQIRPDNVQLVKTLCERGIVSSICSKNTHQDAQRELQKAGIWDYFVFSKIEFTAKGALIAAIIDQANLRPDNVLFLDDNHLNLKEAAHFAPNLMVAHPDDVLPGLLDRPQARGKNDAALTRLAQYKQLERKVQDWASTSNSNEDFLRECDIRVKLDYDVDASFDRVVELIQRANQLNFTKKRMDTAAETARLRASLRRRDAHAGVVRVSDKYGDYGIVGFFLVIQDAGIHQLEHFVFSCRAMNMGVEQYVYERLGEPEITIVQPVANGLKSFDKVDWISLPGDNDERQSDTSSEKLVLIGGCDLLQVASYCSTNRAEHVNIVRDGVIIRYDDYGFLLNPRRTLHQSRILPTIPCWTEEEALAFDADLAEARTVIVSLWVAMRGKHLLTTDGVVARIHPQGLGDFIDEHPRQAFLKECRIVQFNAEQNAELLRRSLERIAALSPQATSRFILGANTRVCNGEASPLDRHNGDLYNATAEHYATSTGLYQFISVNDAVPADQLIDDWHFTRMGYHKLATELLARKKASPPLPAASKAAPDSFDLASFVAKAESVKRSDGVGSTSGAKGWLKRTIKANPLGRLVLKTYRSARQAN